MSNDYSGHRTFRENGVTRHEPLTPDEAKALWREAEQEQQQRAEMLPLESTALHAMTQAYERLRELGWRDIIYCPKDGTMFEAISAGCTGIADCRYEGEWPNGHWWVYEAGDIWPAHPILWRPKPE